MSSSWFGRNMRTLTLSALILVTTLLGPQVVEATTYYVAMSGNDGNPGSMAQPFRTITQGIYVLRPGDTLYVKGGTYEESFYSNIPGGTSWAAPVTIAASPGETVTIRPPASPDLSHVIHFGKPSQQFIILDGLILDGTNAKADIIKIWSGYIRIKNSELRNSPHYAILAIGTPDPTYPAAGGFNEFINLSVHHNGSNDFDNAFYIQSANNVIEGCRFFSNATTSVVFSNQNASRPDNNIVRYNTFTGNGTIGFSPSRAPAIETAEAVNSLIHSNIIHSNRGGGIYLYGTSRENNSMVYNNTIYNNAGFGILIESGNKNAVIKNNIIYQGPSGGEPIMNGGTNATISNNVTTDPRFVDPTGGDLKLASGSPAIDGGVTLTQTSKDFVGTSRPQGTSFDIGAYEYTGGGDTIPPLPPTKVSIY